MKRFGLALLVVVLVATATPLFAQGNPGGTAIARLRGFEEVPAISTTGGGRFNATVNAQGTMVNWELNYFNLEAPVTQAHIHFAQRGVNGGVVVFLCSNLDNAPVGVPGCPPSPGFLSGTFDAADVVAGAAAQGITPGELHSVLRAMRAGMTYVNVHTTLFPGGEIRGQLLFNQGQGQGQGE
ncbi:MAG TPA: CHRD domain-containing protein [Thermoanaerobaculia bacterium]|nr:CHRD domain-containing protein [Thermoanaerobaculia bacterium]